MAGQPLPARQPEGAADFVQRVAQMAQARIVARTHQNEHADAAGTRRALFPEIDSIMGDAVAWPTISRGVAGILRDQPSEGQKEAFSRVFPRCKSLGELLARSLADLRSYFRWLWETFTATVRGAGSCSGADCRRRRLFEIQCQ
ncbi:MAG: hypothetical protein MH208_16805 [Marinobacter sp.]|nr:hypothetical protein [Marinobacter sp.]